MVEVKGLNLEEHLILGGQVMSKEKYPTILHVSIYDKKTCFSLEMRGMPHLFKERLRLVRDVIWTRYGYSSRFSKTDKVWMTDKAVAELISKDIDVFNRYEIDVKLNFKRCED